VAVQGCGVMRGDDRTCQDAALCLAVVELFEITSPLSFALHAVERLGHARHVGVGKTRGAVNRGIAHVHLHQFSADCESFTNSSVDRCWIGGAVKAGSSGGAGASARPPRRSISSSRLPPLTAANSLGGFFGRRVPSIFELDAIFDNSGQRSGRLPYLAIGRNSAANE